MKKMLSNMTKAVAEAGNYLLSYTITGTDDSSDEIAMDNGMYIILVINGTALLTGTYQPQSVCRNDLIILTPSLRGSLSQMSNDLKMACLYIVPAQFDSLTGALPLYNQLVRYHDKSRLPVLSLRNTQAEYLAKSLNLFSGHLSTFGLYRSGMLNNLCSFLLLQITDLFCEEGRNTPVCIRRSNEIYRKFRKLLVDYYKTQHNIGFYAGQLSVSTTYLSRIVKQTSGRTVHTHLTELLLTEAKRLLECTVLDIKQIADSLGFSDQSAFGKFFIKQTGLSPLRFRMKTQDLRNIKFPHTDTSTNSHRLE